MHPISFSRPSRPCPVVPLRFWTEAPTPEEIHDGEAKAFLRTFGQSNRDASTGDFTYDGVVNLNDFNLLASKFGTVFAATGGGATQTGDEEEEQAIVELG